MSAATKPFSDRVRLSRAASRGSYDLEAAYEILDKALFVSVAYVREGQPYITPTAHWREGNKVFFHGSRGSKTLKKSRGQPIALNASLADGLVLARSGFEHSVNYRSLLILGVPEEVEDYEVKKVHLDNFIDRFCPGRSKRVRPPKKKEISATSVLYLPIKEFSIKIRNFNAEDPPEDETFPVWAGVIPLSTNGHTEVACPRMPKGQGREPGIDYFLEKFANGKPQPFA